MLACIREWAVVVIGVMLLLTSPGGGAETAPAAQREKFEACFAAANAAWAQKKFPDVRQKCAKVLKAANAPAHFRSYAQLRIAQSYVAQKNTAAAIAEYEKIRDNSDFPEVHRHEAEECLTELARTAQGLPARDPAASRAKITPVKPAREFFVAPDGDDANPGTAERPVATWARARDLIRKLKAAGMPDGGVAVTFRPGVYHVEKTLTLGAEDSGTAAAPIVYRAETKGTAILYGGSRVSGFTPVKDKEILARLPENARGKVWSANLKTQGITDYGRLQMRGFNQPDSPPPPTLELYCNENPMTLARWPNKGFVPVKSLVSPGDRSKGQPSVVEYEDSRPERWTQARDIWMFGYFRFLWADATLKIASIDTVAKTLTTEVAYQYGNDPLKSMENIQGIIYYAYNLLEEIDRPGEWYLDRESGILYFWPPVNPAGALVEIGQLDESMLTMENVSYVRIEGVNFDLGRYDAMMLKNCSHCLIAAGSVLRFAGNGINIIGGTDNGILGCDISLIGRRATILQGGNRGALTPGRHFIENCQIHSFGRIDRTYTPAVRLDGVGHRAAHNLMYDCPSSVMRIEGNDHLMEYNEVHSAVRESDDQGAMELYRNPTYRGVVFRYNYFHQIGKTGSEGCGQAAIRFDDAISGMLVYGNIFHQAANSGYFGAVQMNSGRDNVIDNNLFIDCKQSISGGWNPGNSIWKMLRKGEKPNDFYTTKLYLTRYPLISRMLEEPGLNYVWRNGIYRCGKLDLSGKKNGFDCLANAVFEKTDPGFVNAAKEDFRLRHDAPLVAQTGFKPIPVEEIGLYNDRYRASWPVVIQPMKIPDWRNQVEIKKKKVRPHPMPPLVVKRIESAPTVDGRLTRGEWPQPELTLKETPGRDTIRGPAATARIGHDEKNLYIALCVPVTGKIETGNHWGDSDGAEVCLRGLKYTTAGKRPPTFVLQGFANGQLSASNNPEEEFSESTRELAQLAQYKAKIYKKGWTAEWKIPLAGMNVTYEPGLTLQFNLGLLRTSNNEWIALAGAFGANYRLDNSAKIILE